MRSTERYLISLDSYEFKCYFLKTTKGEDRTSPLLIKLLSVLELDGCHVVAAFSNHYATRAFLITVRATTTCEVVSIE